MTTATIEIVGRPVAKERPRLFPGRRAFTPKRTRDWEEIVAWSARAQRVSLGAGEIVARVELHTRTPLRGDDDNYVKAILDGLEKGGAFENDRQVRLDGVVRIPTSGFDRAVVHLRAVA